MNKHIFEVIMSRVRLPFSAKSVYEYVKNLNAEITDFPYIPLSKVGKHIGKNFEKYIACNYGEDDLDLNLDLLYFNAMYKPIRLAVEYKKGAPAVSTEIVPGHFFDKNALETEKIVQVGNKIVGKFLTRRIKYGPSPKWHDPNKTKIMFLGKHLGDDEEINKVNFYGSLGRRFLTMVKEELELDDVQIFLSNFVKWSPRIKSDSIIKNFAKDCFHLILNEIHIVEPDIIVFFGGNVLSDLIEKIIKVRPKLYEIETFSFDNIYKNRKSEGLIVSLEFKNSPLFDNSLNNIKRIFSGKYELQEREVDYKVITDSDSLQEIVDEIGKLEISNIALDCEWSGKHVNKNGFLRTIQFATSEDLAYIIEICDETGKLKFKGYEKLADILNKFFLDPRYNIVGSFLYTDTVWLESIGVHIREKYKNIPEIYTRLYEDFIPKNMVLDAAAMVFVQDENAKLGLVEIVNRYFTTVDWDIEGADKGIIPPDKLFPYAAKDVTFLIKILDSLIRGLNSDKNGINLWSAYFNTLRMCSAISEMMSVGVRINEEIFYHMKNSFTDAKEHLLSEIRKALNWTDFDPRKRDHVIEALFGSEYVTKPVKPEGAISLNLTPIRCTNNRLNQRFKTWDKIPEETRKFLTPAVDKFTKGILYKENKIVQMISDFSDLDQLLKTNFGKNSLLNLCDEDGRVRSFITPFLETGRCNSSRPNLQNLSKKKDFKYKKICPNAKPIRSVLTADENYVLIEEDFVSAELFQLAVMSGDKLLLEHCIRGALHENSPDYYDIHSNLAVQAFKLNCEPTKHGLKKVDKIHLRVAAKSIVYGLLYLRGISSIIQQIYAEEGIKITESEAKQIEEAFYNKYSKVKDLQNLLKEIPQTKGYQINYFGRCRRFLKISDEETLNKQQRESINFPFQSMVAECLNILAYRLQKTRDEHRLDFKILLPLHDALLIEARKEIANDLVNEIIPELAKTITFKRWNVDGEAIGEDVYSMSISGKVLN
ncbi:MAG: DNA polymerase [Nitrososphaerota archaeon]